MTAPNLTALDALIAAVEAGDETAMRETARCMSSDARDVGAMFPGYDVGKAYRGSLDAALALHEALLPGHHWALEEDDDAGFGAQVFAGEYWRARNRVAARAWLLAILKAYRAQVAA